MFGSTGASEMVTCIACGEEVDSSAAREYDKHGDRWDRRDKQFEHVCKDCYRDLNHQPRDGLEATLAEAGPGDCDQAAFLRAYYDVVRKRTASE
jgi:hypothetical protein